MKQYEQQAARGPDDLAPTGQADVAVKDGVVTLSGDLDPATGPHGDLIPVAIRVMWTIDGVVDVIDRLGQSQGERQ